MALIRPCGLGGPLSWPAVWVALEWIWPHVFPWRLGHTQIGWLALCQVAEITGTYGISFLLVWAAATVADLLRSAVGREEPSKAVRFSWMAVACGASLVAVVGWGLWRAVQIERAASARSNLDVLLVQPGSRDDEMLHTLRSLSLAGSERSYLVVWGEGAVTEGFSLDLQSFRSLKQARTSSRSGEWEGEPCPRLNCSLLFGAES